MPPHADCCGTSAELAGHAGALVVAQAPPVNGVCVVVHAPPEQVTTVLHSRAGSVPYSHASWLVEQADPSAGRDAGQDAPASCGAMQPCPLHPGASAAPHIHCPPEHVATPYGSWPQQLERLLPKQLGAVPLQPVPASGEASGEASGNASWEPSAAPSTEAPVVSVDPLHPGAATAMVSRAAAVGHASAQSTEWFVVGVMVN